MIYTGIDNGLKGGIVVLDSNANVIQHIIMPVIKGKKDEYDIKELVSIFDSLKQIDNDIRIYLEKAYVRPIQGIRAAFGTGFSLGMIQGILESKKISYEIVNPTVWMKAVFLGVYNKKEKKQSVLWAQRKWPNTDWRTTERCKVINDGLTDAAGIAYYGYLQNKGNI